MKWINVSDASVSFLFKIFQIKSIDVERKRKSYLICVLRLENARNESFSMEVKRKEHAIDALVYSIESNKKVTYRWLLEVLNTLSHFNQSKIKFQ